MFIRPGDEVILPSFCFPSCANAVVLRGGVPVFVDIRCDTLNLDLDSVEEALGPKTKAVLPIHYAGVSCEPGIFDLKDRGLYVIEDAAQCIGNWTLKGDVGCISFHSTKNVQCGEGGVILVKPQYEEQVELLRDCGTTKAKFRRGESDGYDWLGVGSSYLMSEYTANALEENLEHLAIQTHLRQKAWSVYKRLVQAPHAQKLGNGHIFWFLTDNQREVIRALRERGVKAASHYEAAHLTQVGRKYGRSVDCKNASYIASRIVRLPTNVSESEAVSISNVVNEVLYDFRRVQAQGSEQAA